MDDKQKKPEPSHFEETVGMTGPVKITDYINEKEDPELQETENDDMSVIRVQHEPTDDYLPDEEEE